VILISMMVLYVLQPPDVSPFQFASTLVVLAGLLVINVFLDDLKRLLPDEQASIWVIVLLSSALAFYVIVAGRLFIGVYILFMIIAQANAMLPLWPSLGLSAALLGGYLGLLAWNGTGPADLRATAVGLLIGATFTVTLSQVLQRFSEQTERANHLLAQLQQANAELLAARQKEKELVIAEERVRVARDLHDGLGHHLTALSIQLQAAEKLVRANPDLAAEAVRNARGEVQAALNEVRQSVAALREAPVELQHLPQAIAALVEETGRRSGLDGRFEQSGPAGGLSPAAAMTLYRAAQEGLTNLQKHARGATRFTVRLAYGAREAALSVEDDGREPPDGSLEEAGRFGLAGLRERANLLGGELAYGPLPSGGFFLRLRLPTGTGSQGGPP
jgi:signal transduction histidine kinase